MLPENERILNEYLATRGLSSETQAGYASAVTSWGQVTGLPITGITRDNLKQWFTGAIKELAAASVLKYAANLLRIHTYILTETEGFSNKKARAEAGEVFEVIPFKDLTKREKKDNSLRDKLITQAEFKALLKAAKKSVTKALITVTYESGCRKGEIFSLRLRDVSAGPDHWTLTVEGKTGTRVVPIIKSIPYLRAWLQQHPNRGDENAPLFTVDGVKPMRERGFNHMLSYICRKAGLRHLHPHMLRHTRLTDLADRELGEFQMKTFAGWTMNSPMPQRYLHLTGRSHMKAVLKTEGVENGAEERLDTKPLLELVRCPQCDARVGGDVSFCPSCGYVLDDKLRIERGDRVQQLQVELETAKQAVGERDARLNNVEQTLGTLMRALSHPESGPVLWKALRELEEKAPSTSRSQEPA